VPGTAVAYRSTDAGASWTRLGAVGVQSNCCLLDTAAAPDGRLYVTWPEAAADGGSDVLLASSRDGGATWQTTAVAHSTGAIPTSAVATRPDGSVGVFWYAPGATATVTPSIAVSRDSGASWGQPIAVGHTFEPDTIETFVDTGPFGPYQDIAGTPEGFRVAFTAGGADVSAGGTSDVVLARVRVR
jgi:hypothetical protein